MPASVPPISTFTSACISAYGGVRRKVLSGARFPLHRSFASWEREALRKDQVWRPPANVGHTCQQAMPVDWVRHWPLCPSQAEAGEGSSHPG